MNRGPLIFLGTFLTIAFSWFGLVFTPFMQFQGTDPVKQETGDMYPRPLEGAAAKGVKVYQAMGCVYCHSQQVRPKPYASDLDRGWGGIGKRRTVPLDYIHDKPVLLGTMRTGPDLANIGYLSDVVHQHKHLYDPRYKLADSIMPAFRFLYEWVDESGVQADEKTLADELTKLANEKEQAKNKGKKLVPSSDARALVAYLLSLKRDAPLPAPKPKPENP